MRNCYCISIVFFFLCSTAIYAQKHTVFNRSFHPEFEKASVKDFLDDLNNRGGLIIEYASNTIDTSKIIRLHGNPETIGAVLQQVLKEQRISVIEKNGKIIITPSENILSEDALTNYFSVFGFVKEKNSEEPLAEATIWDPEFRRGTLSNTHGYYTLLLPEGKHIISYTYAGHTARQIEIDLQKDVRFDLQLEPRPNIKEVIITSPSAGKKEGVDKIGYEEVPYENLLGEPDALRSLYLLPGVKNIPEISNGILVRGGTPDQNVFLLDGNTVFNPTHLLGTVSIVNKTSLKSMQLFKSNFPSRYGGGLSAVIDVATKDGNMKEWKGEGNAGLLVESITLEGPLKKDKAAIMFSFRHSWMNPALKLLNSAYGATFHDLHFKYTQLVGKKDKLMFNIYEGHDKLNLQNDNTNSQQMWGNKAVSFAWNHLLGTRAFLNTAISYSSYKNTGGFRYLMYDSIGNNVQNKAYNTFSTIEQYSASSQLELSATNHVRFNMGTKISFSRIKPFETNISADFASSPDQANTFPSLYFNEAIVFYENEFRVHRFFFRPGIYLSNFHFKNFQYTSPQLRFYSVYQLTSSQKISLSYNQMTQYLHLVTNPYLGINSDAWVPSTSVLRPEQSDMINLGYQYGSKKKFVFTAEAYYKSLRHVTNYVEGRNLFLNNADWEQNLELGKGWSYGLELRIGKKMEKWEAYIGYTLSWNWRQFNDINEGKKFPFKYDRRHDLNVSGYYNINKHWNFSAIWWFATGDMFTLPTRIYPDFDDAQQISDPYTPTAYRLIYHSSVTNQFRTLPYNKLDVSVNYFHMLRKKIHAVLTMGVYNIYGSPSQYLYDIEGTIGKRSLIVTTKYQLFNITPNLSYTVSF